MKNLLSLIFVVNFLVGCAGVHTKGSYVNLLENNNLEQVTEAEASKVVVFYKKAPDFDFTEVAIVEAVASGEDAGLEDLFKELKLQAALIPADGVYKIEVERYDGASSAIHATSIAIKRK